MDFSRSAVLSPRIMEQDGDDFIFSGIDDHFPDVVYQPNQYQHNAFTDHDEFLGSTDQMMEDDETNLAMVFESGVENVTSQLSVSSSATAATSSSTASPAFFHRDELVMSPASFEFISMILQEPLNDNAAVGLVDDSNSGGNSDVTNKRSRSVWRNEAQVKEHILSERKRREKLSKLFIAIAAMVPGLKKTDKGSILLTAIAYLKQLKAREAWLKEEIYKKKSNKLRIQTKEDPISSSIISPDTTVYNSIKDILNIGVKYDGKDVLIRIKYKTGKKWEIVNLLHEIELMGLTLHNFCMIPFDDSYIVSNIIVEMNGSFSLTGMELETKLHGLIMNQ